MLIAAVDVGSSRARAGLFTMDGHLVARASRGFETVHGSAGQAGYHFEEIWRAVADALAEARRLAGASPSQVSALAFDATCSLVVEAPGFSPDVIAWHDHRATSQAGALDAISHPVIDRAGGAISPEMQTPKLMWLARHRPDIWANLRGVRDLADHLAFRATGVDLRSGCTMVAKWPWIAERGGWQDDLLAQIGCQDLPRPAGVIAPGATIGQLSAQGSADLGLDRETVVAAGLIDAFAGALGAAPGMPALIAGTSNCVMAWSQSGGRGIWGPYPDAILPDVSVIEVGQSATGAALESVRSQYPTAQSHDSILQRIGEKLGQSDAGDLGAGLHVLPDFKGNRAPFADPLMRAVVHGMPLSRSTDQLDAFYWRVAVGVALGTRQIVAHAGLDANRIAMAGGQARSALLRQLYADSLGVEVHWQPEDAVLRGTAIAAGAALMGGLAQARLQFARPVKITHPDRVAVARRETDWRIFLRMQEHRAEIMQYQTGMA